MTKANHQLNVSYLLARELVFGEGSLTHGTALYTPNVYAEEPLLPCACIRHVICLSALAMICKRIAKQDIWQQCVDPYEL